MSEHNAESAAPDIDTVQQFEDGGIRVPVRLDQNVPVYILPSRSGAARSYGVDATNATILVGKDPRRRRATIVSIDQHIYVGSKDEVVASTAAVWPKLVPLVVEHTEEIYVKAATATSTVSVIPEHWAD
jgi:hypothetical protein